MNEDRRTGVYGIVNLKDGKRYVGSAARGFGVRWRQHRHLLRCGRHHSRHLQRAWNRDGEAAFEFAVLLVCDVDDCVRMEQVYIDTFNSANDEFGYNIEHVAGSSLGVKRSAETKKRIRQSKRGQVLSQEARQTISDALRGRKRSPETCAKMSAAKIGRRLTPEHVAKMSASKRGVRRSPEAIAKSAAGLRGRPQTAEHRAKIAAAHRGKKHSPETIRKLSESHNGIIPSEATRAKLSASRLGRIVSQDTRAKIASRERSAEEIEKSAAARRGVKRNPEQCARILAGRMLSLSLKKAKNENYR